MKFKKAFWIAGAVVLAALIIGPCQPAGSGFTRGPQRFMSEHELRDLAWNLISYAEDHCDNFPTSMANLSDESFEQYGFEYIPYAHGNHVQSFIPDAEPSPYIVEAFSHHSYIATADRRHLVVFERPGLWDDHTVAYLDLNTGGKWTEFHPGLEDATINRVTEQQFAEFVSKLAMPTPSPTPADKLVSAVECGDNSRIETIVSGNIAINEEDQRGWTPLTSAAQEGQIDTVQLLLNKGANINSRDSFGLGRTALMRASASGHTAIVETLLAHGADVHIRREDGSSALADALPYPIIVAKLIAAGADCNEQMGNDRSPLIAACSDGYAESARLLIQHGADIKRDGLIALDAGIRNDRGDAIHTLLMNGVSADKEYLGQCLSSAYASPQAMKELLAAGADVSAKCTCPGGRTALMISAINGCPETVDLLIGAGADLNAKDGNGHTALDLMLAATRSASQWMIGSSAEKARLLGIVDVLRKSGAKESGLYVEWPESR